jgi:hypothetical protein
MSLSFHLQQLFRTKIFIVFVFINCYLIALTITVTASARVGDEVTASGLADPNTWVSIKGLDNTQNIVYFDAVKSDADGKYSNTFKIPAVPVGKMTVVAGYGKNVAVKELNIQTGTPPEEKDTDEKTGGGGGGGSGGSGVGSTPPADTTKTVGSSGRTITQHGAVISIPAAAVAGDVKVKVEKVSNPSTLPVAANSRLVSDVMEITKDKSGDFKKAVTVTLAFEKSKVDADKYDLSLCYLDEKAGKWIELDNVKVDIKAGKVTGEITHFTKFAIIATEKPGVIDKEQPQPVEKDKKAIDLKDIQGHWAEKTIKELVASGAVSGYPDGTFQPNKTITRAEFSTILVKAFNLETRTGKVFNDTAGHWAKDNIATAQAHGIVSGYSDTTFGPNDNITREQMAVMIVKAAKLSESAAGKTFADSSQISTWAQQAVATASENQIINGYPDNTFKPKASATRAEAATVIVKAL